MSVEFQHFFWSLACCYCCVLVRDFLRRIEAQRLRRGFETRACFEFGISAHASASKFSVFSVFSWKQILWNVNFHLLIFCFLCFFVCGTCLIWLIPVFFLCHKDIHQKLYLCLLRLPLCVNLRKISLYFILHLPFPGFTSCWSSLNWLGFCILVAKQHKISEHLLMWFL